jgi:hypothetical protein
MRLVATVDLPLPIDDVFCFVRDPRNDARWCPRVTSCQQIHGDGPHRGAVYVQDERPTLRPPQQRRIEILDVEAPTTVVTRHIDQQGEFEITYTLEPLPEGCRLTQRDDIAWVLPLPVRPIAGFIVRHHMRGQLRNLTRAMGADNVPEHR